MESLADQWELKDEGLLSPEAMQTILNSVNAVTRSRRSKDCERFASWLKEKEVSEFDCRHVLEFLEQAATPTSYASLRTSISTTIKMFSDFKITELALVQRHAQGWARRHPKAPKYETMFDAMLLYSHFRNFNPDQSNWVGVRTKALILLRLSIAGRNRDVHAIDYDSIKFSEKFLEFRFYRWKTQASSGRKFSNFFKIVKMERKESICTYVWFKKYLDMNRQRFSELEDDPRPRTPWLKFRGGRITNANSLLDNTKVLMASAGVDTTIYGPGSLRHAAISLWRERGISEDSVKKRTGHRSLRIISEYYDRSSSNVDLMASVLQSDREDESDVEDEWDPEELE